MCRMIGKFTIQRASPEYELLSSVHSLRQQSVSACQPDNPDLCGPHASGCGISWLDEDVLKLERRAENDRWDDSFTELISSIETTALIAHNRKSSPGLKVDVSCSHPYLMEFKGQSVAFSHNGGVDSLMNSAKDQDKSDSLILLEDLLSCISDLSIECLKEYLVDRSSVWCFSSLTGLLLTGDMLFAWRCYNSESLDIERYEKYYTLYTQMDRNRCLVASEPIDRKSGWNLIKNRSLLCIQKLNGCLKLEQIPF